MNHLFKKKKNCIINAKYFYTEEFSLLNQYIDYYNSNYFAIFAIILKINNFLQILFYSPLSKMSSSFVIPQE